MPELQTVFAGCTGRPLLLDEPMRRHTSFRIGGPADVMALPQNEEELSLLLERAKAYGVPVTVIGNGSNLLVLDKGIRGLVIKLGGMLAGFRQEGTALTFASGCPLAFAAHKAAELSLSGLEFASGIPGTIGGAVYMNAGAYGGEMAQIVEAVRVMDPGGRLLTLAGDDLRFGYRSTALKGSDYIVLSVRVRLTGGDRKLIEAKMDELNGRRVAKQPLEYPSAGSTFKRPPGNFAGTLIEKAGLKGFTVGGAQVSAKHAGFIINTGGATASDVLALIRTVQAKVMAASGVSLEPEVLILGEE